MDILKLKNISFSYNSKPFVKNLSLSLGEGELVGIFGSNGSGKTTILKLSSGILNPKEGSVDLWERDMTSYKGVDRAKLISYLPQVLTQGVPFTVREVVTMGSYPLSKGIFDSGAHEMTLDESLKTVGLEGKKDSYLAELSGGELRRVFVAMTLLQGARIVLLDEPFANLDIKYQMGILSLLKTLRDEKNFTIMMAVHDLNLMRQFDRVVFIKEGSIVTSGAPDDVLTPELLSDVYEIPIELANSVHPIDPL